MVMSVLKEKDNLSTVLQVTDWGERQGPVCVCEGQDMCVYVWAERGECVTYGG